MLVDLGFVAASSGGGIISSSIYSASSEPLRSVLQTSLCYTQDALSSLLTHWLDCRSQCSRTCWMAQAVCISGCDGSVRADRWVDICAM